MNFNTESRTGAYLFMALGITFIFACIYLTIRDGGSLSAMNGLLAIAGGLTMGKGFTVMRHLSAAGKEKKQKKAGSEGGSAGSGLNRAQRRRKKG